MEDSFHTKEQKLFIFFCWKNSFDILNEFRSEKKKKGIFGWVKISTYYTNWQKSFWTFFGLAYLDSFLIMMAFINAQIKVETVEGKEDDLSGHSKKPQMPTM